MNANPDIIEKNQKKADAVKNHILEEALLAFGFKP
jgi:hypothetical protein